MEKPARTHAGATYQDVLDAPEHLVAELVGGELQTSPRPAIPHASASSELGAELLMAFGRGRGGPGGWWILDEPELHLGEDVLVPDVAGWRRERLPAMPRTGHLSLAPDWVCEVSSPSTHRFDRLVKMPVYLREQVGFVWLVDPMARYIEAFQLSPASLISGVEGHTWSLCGRWGDETQARIPPFDAVALDVTAWWLAEE
ncbi:MAG: Uma2 family endonuclease [Myxococcota bacterium]|jgi:Uma2 family endonuclease|nr:Uma2 family endonuclease [Myxococcota bacterium]